MEIMKMKPKVKTLWLEALRSGKYKQGKHYLKSKNLEYCCLGVLCEVYSKTQKKKGFNKDPFRKMYDFDDIICSLPIKVAKWSGLLYNDKTENSYGSYGDGRYLSQDNDVNNKTFKQIAKIIEDNF